MPEAPTTLSTGGDGSSGQGASRADREALEQLLYVVSHDFRAPLRQARQLAQWVVEDCRDLPPTAQEHLRLLDRCLDRAQRMLDGLLELSRVGRRPTPSDPRPLRSRLVESLQTLALPDGVSLTLPDATPPVGGDLGRLVQALTLLVDNAVAHGVARGGVVTVSADATPDGARFTVHDDGVGMEPRVLERARELFYSTAPKSGRHVGVGLTLTQRIADLAGGSLQITSSQGAGTRAELLWPQSEP